MSIDNLLSYRFYLTLEGWKPGVRYSNEQRQGDEPPLPVDRLATYELRISEKSARSEEQRSWTLVEQLGSDKQIEECLAQFPKPDETTQF